MAVSARAAVAMLGGTFDPIHIGHLRSAVELREILELDEVRLVPAHRPPHREQPGAGPADRLKMVELAVSGEPGLVADDRELRRDGPSYSFDTLAGLRAELGPDCSLSLVMGADAFAGFDGWYRWRELCDLAHLVVMARPDCPLPADGPVAELLERRRAEPGALHAAPAGHIVYVALTPLPVSATGLRAIIGSGRSPRYLLPDPVWSYIRERGLYVPPH